MFTFLRGVMLLNIVCTLHVLANMAPNARVKPIESIQARAYKSIKHFSLVQ
jgi:hypothetical protein